MEGMHRDIGNAVLPPPHSWKKICIVADNFYPAIGGTERLSKQLADYFSTDKSVRVLTLERSRSAKLQYPVDYVSDEDLDLKMDRYFSSHRFDIVIFLCDIYSRFFIRFNISRASIEKSILVLNHNDVTDREFRKLLKKSNDKDREEIIGVLSDALRGYHKVITFCKNSAVNNLLDEFGIEAKYISNFTEEMPKGNYSMRKDKDIPDNKKIIFYHGRTDENKNILTMLKTFEKSGKSKSFVICIMGAVNNSLEYKYLAECERYVLSSRDLKNNVKFIEQTNDMSIISSCLEESDVYFLPSIAEASPLTLMESMSCGTPWISTPVGDVPTLYNKTRSGRILKSKQFKVKDFNNKIDSALKIDREVVRKEWEEKYKLEIVIKRYEETIKEIMDDSQNFELAYEFAKDSNFSFAVCAYNEENAIERYFRSILKAKIPVKDIFVVNHRSDDNTEDVIKKFISIFSNNGIKLSYVNEKRDFSPSFTFADLRRMSVEGCRGEVMFVHDADFVFGIKYLLTIYKSLNVLMDNTMYACGYKIPVVTFIKGRQVNIHPATPTVLKRGGFYCRQNRVGSRYFWFYPKGPKLWTIIEDIKSSVISIDDKGIERNKLRSTMNDYFDLANRGLVSGTWIESYEKKELEIKDQAEENEQRVFSDISGEEFFI